MHEKLFMSVYSSSPFLCQALSVTFLPKRSVTYVVKLKFSPHPLLLVWCFRLCLGLRFVVGVRRCMF